jgi:hypothetical protein
LALRVPLPQDLVSLMNQPVPHRIGDRRRVNDPLPAVEGPRAGDHRGTMPRPVIDDLQPIAPWCGAAIGSAEVVENQPVDLGQRSQKPGR